MTKTSFKVFSGTFPIHTSSQPIERNDANKSACLTYCTKPREAIVHKVHTAKWLTIASVPTPLCVVCVLSLVDAEVPIL